MTMSYTRRALMALLAASALAGCSKTEAPAPAVPAVAPAAVTAAPPAAKVYVAATNAAYAPFESMSADGKPVGFDIDVLSGVAAKAGFQVQFINTPWEGIFNTLSTGERDLVISSVTITDARKQSMDFSAPYFDAGQLIAVRQNSSVAKLDDLESLQVGVQTGTTGDEVVQKLLGKDSPNIKRFESTPLALKELEAGGVAAVVADNGVVSHYIANNPGAKFKSLTDNSFAPEQYGIVVKKGNAALLAKVNEGLAAIKADGTYDKIYAQYFGAKP